MRVSGDLLLRSPAGSQIDRATQHTDHIVGEVLQCLETIWYHGLKLNKGQKLGLVLKFTLCPPCGLFWMENPSMTG